MDLAIINVEDEIIQIENKGGKAVTFNILITFEDGEIHKEEISPSVWKDNSVYTHKYNFRKKATSKIELLIPPGGDAMYKNNVWEQ